MLKILCHVGPWCVNQYKAIANSVDPDANVTLISGFKNFDETGFQSSYYNHVKNKSAKLTGLDEDDFILRCRLLRSLSRDEARLHLYSTRDAIAKVLDELKPDLVISEVVDQFLIDLLRHECNQRSIPFYGLVVSFINGYFRITGRGEKSQIRNNVKDDEVEKVLSRLVSVDYTPSFVKGRAAGWSLWKNLFYRLYKSNLKIPYFYAKRYFSGELYNYHYWASYVSALENYHLFPRIKLGKNSSLLVDEQKQTKKPRIYIPLQMYPEATIEYWCDELEVINYNEVLLQLVRKLSEDFEIIVKEHPNVLGLRNPSLYDQLNEIDGVFFCETFSGSNDLVGISDAVLVWTGSVGFEAALRGKPVLTMTEPYYMSGDRFKLIDLNTCTKDINDFIKSTKDIPIDHRSMIKYVLHGLAPGKYKNDFSWSASNKSDVEDAAKIGVTIANMHSSMKVTD